MARNVRKRAKAGVILLIVGGVLAVGTGATVYAAGNYVPRVEPGTKVGPIEIGGLERTVARQKLQEWWKDAAARPVNLSSPELTGDPDGWTAESLGCSLDIEATLQRVAWEDFWRSAERKLGGGQAKPSPVKPVVRVNAKALTAGLAKSLTLMYKKPSPAKAVWNGEAVVATKEGVKSTLDIKALADLLPTSVLSGDDLFLPMQSAAKHVPDSELSKVKTIVSQFTTHFDTGKETRCHNIQLAAKLLNGRIVMPGETFSFNKALGERTREKGFQQAGVYKNGRHDFDIGGGICQVSTTLYNTILRTGLEVVSRSPHTYPVPYVPLGQDAAVSFPDPDFGFKNTGDSPVAISTSYSPGTLTFRLLGLEKDPHEYRFVHKELKEWSKGPEYVNDPSLPYGREVVVDKGGAGHEVETWRVVLENGVEVKREDLGTSYYPGGPRIIAVNKSASRPAKPALPAAPAAVPGNGF